MSHDFADLDLSQYKVEDYYKAADCLRWCGDQKETGQRCPGLWSNATPAQITLADYVAWKKYPRTKKAHNRTSKQWYDAASKCITMGNKLARTMLLEPLPREYREEKVSEIQRTLNAIDKHFNLMGKAMERGTLTKQAMIDTARFVRHFFGDLISASRAAKPFPKLKLPPLWFIAEASMREPEDVERSLMKLLKGRGWVE